jgi:NAD(P)-dependent dehydrogenase (short-subunit alcohol dehydrogenase family)
VINSDFGGIDILVNSAELISANREEVTENAWDKVINIIQGAFFCCQSVGKIMIKKSLVKYQYFVSSGTVGLISS